MAPHGAEWLKWLIPFVQRAMPDVKYQCFMSVHMFEAGQMSHREDWEDSTVVQILQAGKYVVCILVPMMERLCTHHYIVN